MTEDERMSNPAPEILLSGLPELVVAEREIAEQDDTADGSKDAAEQVESIDSPAKVMRIGTMLKRLLKQARSMDLDEASRQRLREIYEVSVGEIGSALSPDLQEELSRLISSFDQPEPPSAAELQIAKAQLVGWLEGLLRGMQAMLFAQQLTARRQLEAMRSELLPGEPSSAAAAGSDDDAADRGADRPSAYL